MFSRWLVANNTLRMRFRTSADLPGVERVAITVPPKSFLEKPYRPLEELHPGLV